MSDIFQKAYAVFFVVQLAIFFVAYLILRLKTKLKALTALCLSVFVVTALTLLLLWFNPSSIVHVYRADLWEYVTGTLFVAALFMLILIIRFLAPLLKEIISSQRAADPERTRILRMIEEGKITAEEGSDLLEAMGKSNAMRGQDRFSLLDMAILCGVAFVVMGFFLPWVYIRNSMYQAGHQIGALGWTIFIIALVSIVPVFITPKNLLYKISMFHLFVTLVGLLLAFITLLRAGNHLGIGIVVCTVGFTVELIASGAKFKRLVA
jgi:hypothetical protein